MICRPPRAATATGFTITFAIASSIAALSVIVMDAAVPPAATKQQEPGAAQGVSVRWITNASAPRQAVVEVSGLSGAVLKQLRADADQPNALQRWLAVHTEQGDWMANIGVPPLYGTYRLDPGGVLRFEPRFPLEPGLSYRAVFRFERSPVATELPAEVVSVLKVPARPMEASTVVSQIYPTAAALPENLLKFYIHFSAPMRRGHIYDHIHLRDAAGKEIELPFLEIDEELWDPAMTRLTLFIDPGRIKRGVQPLEEVGPALEAGKRFTLEIDREWKDAAGSPLRQAYRKSFEVVRADREPPNVAQWKIRAPQGNTRAALSIVFSKSMDHALAQRMIRVTDPAGQTVAGSPVLSDEERCWTFTPVNAWQAGPHQLWIQTTIEDLAGNNIGKPFEVDMQEPVQRQLDRSSVKLPFEVLR